MNENQTALIQMNIRKIKESDALTKSNCIKSLSFLILTYKTEATSFIETILSCLEECLIIPENEVNLSATNLIQQIILAYQKQQAYSVIKRKLIKQLVRNLGETKMQLRKMSHKCLLEFVKKYEDYDTLIFNYLCQGIQNNTENPQLKQKCLNSFQSILILEYKHLNLSSHFTKRIFQNIIDILMSEEQSQQVLKAANQCMHTICRLRGVKALLNLMSKQYTKKMEQIGSQLPILMQQMSETEQQKIKKINLNNPKIQKEKEKEKEQIKSYQMNSQQIIKNTLTPLNGQKNIRKDKIILNDNLSKKKQISEQIVKSNKSINQELASAEQMLKRMQQYKNDINMIDEIFSYLPTLQSNFNDRRTQLFNISVRMMQVILQIKICDDKLYVKVVPPIVERLNDQKFLVRNSINKLIKQFLKSYTKIWIENFFNNLRSAVASNFKEDLITLLIVGYESYSPIEYSQLDAIKILSKEAENKRKNIKTKAIQCMQLILKHNSNPELQYSIKDIVSQQLYTLLIGKSQLSTPKFFFRDQKDTENNQNVIKNQNIIRMNDEIPLSISQQQDRKLITEVSEKKKSQSNQKRTRYQSIKRNERIATEIQSSQKKIFKKHQSMSGNYTLYKQEPESAQINNKVNEAYNPEKFISPNKIRVISLSSPKKTSIKNFKDPENMDYVPKQYLPQLSDAKKQSDTLLQRFRDKSWKIQFSALNCTRSLIQHNQELVLQKLSETLQQILKGVLSLRSSISKNSLICLDQLINKLKRRLDPYIDIIIQKIMKKTLYTNQFLQEEVKKCLISISTNLNESKLLTSLIHHKQNKSTNVKTNILIVLENLIKNQKIYRKEIENIWMILLSFKEEAAIQIRQLTKKYINYIIENYSDWKIQLLKFMKKQDIQKIEEFQKKIKMPKINDKKEKSVLNQKINVQIQDLAIIKRPGKQEKINQSPKKYSTVSLSSMNQFAKLEELQKGSRNFKDWKNRISSILEIYKIAFKYPKQFCQYSNGARYIMLLCQHLQDPNIKVAMNALGILEQSMQILKPIIQEYLMQILLRLINGIASKKSEYSSKCEQIYAKLKLNTDNNKIVKELLKLALNPILKTKIGALKQLCDYIYYLSKQSLTILSPIITKIMNKLSSQQKNLQIIQRIKNINNSINHLMSDKIQK